MRLVYELNKQLYGIHNPLLANKSYANHLPASAQNGAHPPRNGGRGARLRAPPRELRVSTPTTPSGPKMPRPTWQPAKI